MEAKKTVEIIVHAYSVQIPDFARLLTAQLSSLVLWPPAQCEVLVSVCTSEDDVRVHDACRNFHEQHGLRVNTVNLPLHLLWRRAIGRNMLAKMSQADIVWFADCDYLIGSGFLDAVAQLDFPAPCIFPRRIMVHKSHQLGDQEISQIVNGEVFNPDLSLFHEQRVKIAIGGLQIVLGDVARKGYLDGTRYTRPLQKLGSGFRDTTEDKVYRGAVGAQWVNGLPWVYRMRHSRSAFESQETRLAQTSKDQSA